MSIPQQAGIYAVTLYERNSLILTYTDENTISNIATSGQTVFLDYCDKIKFRYDCTEGKNLNLLYNYFIDFIYDGLTETIKAQINTIKDSIYGWSVLIEYINGEYWFIDELMELNETEVDTGQSHTFQLQLYNKMPSKNKPLKYEEGV